MTREEARQILEDYVKACREDDFFKIETGFTYEKVIEAMDMGAKSLLSHSLPSDLDEAAEKYAKGEGLENALGGWEDMSDAFKAGAEWMAGQGETIFDTIDIDGQGQRWITDNMLQGDYDGGEEVIIQIRKK